MGLVASSLLFAPLPSQAFENIYWHEDTFPIGIYLHDADVSNLTIEEQEKILQRSLDTWNSVPCAAISFVYAGRLAGTGAPSPDDQVEVVFIKSPEAWFYSTKTGATGFTTSTKDPTPIRHQVDIELNAVYYEWGEQIIDSTEAVLDMQSVVTHELGHVLGLPHSGCRDRPCVEGESNAATMAERYLSDLGTQTLSLSDKVALCEKYWVPIGECESDSDCPAGSVCETYESEQHGDSVGLCAEVHGAAGDACGVYEQGLRCVERCNFLLDDYSQGYCTYACSTDADCPEGDEWVCSNQDFYCIDRLAAPVLPSNKKDDDCSIFCVAGGGRGPGWYWLVPLMIILVRREVRRLRTDRCQN